MMCIFGCLTPQRCPRRIILRLKSNSWLDVFGVKERVCDVEAA